MPERLCLFCKDPIPLWANKRRVYCDHYCAMTALRDREYKSEPAQAPAHVLNPDQIRCNLCGVVLASPRELLAHKRAEGRTRNEEVKSQIGSSLDGINA